MKCDAILTSDWHIRKDTPLCRVDDYREAQARKIEYIIKLANENDCPILVAGDFGHKPYWGDELLNWAIELLNDAYIITIPGQHDLPNHRLDKVEEAGLGILDKALKQFILLGGEEEPEPQEITPIRLFSYPYSCSIDTIRTNYATKKVAIIHQMVIKSQNNKLWNDQKANSAKGLLKKFPCYDLIVSGDNHQSFAVEYEGRWLVNPGSIMRMTAAQIQHRPSVYLWWAESNTVERHLLPIEDNVIDTSHIEESKERDERIEAFISKLPDTAGTGFDFRKNLSNYLEQNRARKGVVQKIWEAMEI